MNVVVWLLFLVVNVALASAGELAGIGGRGDGGSDGGQGEKLLERMEPVFERSPEMARARKLWSEGKLDGAVSAFEEGLALADPSLSGAARYLRANVLLDSGDFEAAAQAFEETAVAVPLLRDWALYRAGTCRFDSKQYDSAVTDFQGLSAEFPRLRKAVEKSCEALFLKGDGAGFDGCLQRLSGMGSVPPSLLLLHAQSALEAGNRAESVRVVKKILVEHPSSSAAKGAGELADRLRKEGEAKRLELSDEEKLDRAERLFKEYRYSAATSAIGKLHEERKKGGKVWCRANSLLALILARKGEQTNSLAYFERFVDNCDSVLTDAVLYRGVEAACMAGKDAPASKWAYLLAERFAESTLCDDALLHVARLYDRQGEAKKTREVVDAILRQFPDGDMAPDAAWLPVFSLYRSGEYGKALEAAVEFYPALPERQDYRTNGRLEYWMGRCQQHLKKRNAAAAWFRKVVEKYPLSWYALLSVRRLEAIKKGMGDECLAQAVRRSEKTLPDAKDVLDEAATLGGRLEVAVFMMSMGMQDEAQSELGALKAGQGRSVEHKLAAALLHSMAGDVVNSHHILRREAGPFAYAWPQEDDDRWWKTAYPRAFASLVDKAAADHGVPWSLISAVMREESGFDPEIESYAHALGLMQLLQKTATWVAKKEVGRSDLRVPATNIPLGTQYLKYLQDRFGHPALAVAGYNSGPGGVNKTLKRIRNNELDEFVESIPYDQTRRYTKRVLSSAWTYQVLYGDEKGVSSIDLAIPDEKKR